MDCCEGAVRGIRTRVLLVGAALLVGIVSLWRISLCLPNDGLLDVVSGAWLTLATDAADGVLYRPICGDLGYGGTRYFPLQVMLHGGLIRGGMAPIASGYLIGLASTAALVAGAFFILRGMGFSRWFSFAVAMLTLSTLPAQYAMATIRGDALPAALNVWGLAFAVRLFRPGPNRRDAFLAGGFFAFAFAAKVTMVFGLAASILALLCARRICEALKLAGCWAVVAGLILGTAWFLSDGRFAENIQKCASGGATWTTLKYAPWNAFRSYTAGIIFMAIAFGVLLASPRRAWATLPALWLVISAAGSSVMFGSPGIKYTHLLDSVVAAVLATVLLAGPKTEKEPLIPSLLAVTAMLCLFGSVFTFYGGDKAPHRAQMQEILAALPKSDRPMLAESNVMPILNHERPYMLDCFSFHVLALKDPSLAQRLEQELREHRFRAVVLINDPRKEGFDEDHFYPGFAAAVVEYYDYLTCRQSPSFAYFVFVPKTAPATVR